MALKTSLLITGDSSVAQKAVEDLAKKQEALGASGRSAAAGLEAQARAEDAASAAGREMATALSTTSAELQRAQAGTLANTKVVREHSRASNDNAKELQRHAAGLRNLGQQFGDLAVMVQGGIDPIRAFATQAGQMGYAMSELNGRMGKVGAFLTGPWGIALTIATTTLAPFVAKLFETGEAARQAELATSSLGDAQSMMADLFGKASSKIAEQNELLRLNARLKAVNLRAEAAQQASEATTAFRQTGAPDAFGATLRAFNTAIGGTGRGLDLVGIGTGNTAALALARRARQANAMADSAARMQAFDRLIQDAARTDFSGSGIDRAGFLEAISKSAASRANSRIADLIDQSLTAGRVNPLLEKPERGKKTKKAPSTAGRDEFGRDAIDRIAGIVDQFDRTPPAVRQAQAAVRQLDDLMEDLARRKPPGFAATIASAREAKSVVEASLNRPLEEYLDGQREQLRQQQLLIEGRTLEAEAARAIVAIERQRGPLSAEQKDEVLASVAALQAQERTLERIRAVQQTNLNAVRDIQQIVTQTVYEGPKSLANLPGRILESFRRNFSEQLVERAFGDIFRDMRDQITGVSKVDAATNTLVTSFATTATAAQSLAASLGKAASVAAGVPAGAANDNAGVDGPDIVVTGQRPAQRQGPIASSEIYAETIGRVLHRLGLGQDTAATLGKNAGRALAGAFEGQAAAGVANMIGLRTSNTGAGIGGAIGGLLGNGGVFGALSPITSALGPFGSLLTPALGVLGGVLGGLFKSVDKGSATIGDTTSRATTSGNDSAYERVASGLAGSVQDGLTQIAQQLGGAVGAFAPITIGKYGESFKVNTTGGTTLKKGKRGVVDFDEDEAGAIAFAIRTAIERGAVTGLSAAVQRAISSSPDLNKAIAEAMKVQEVELLLGGTLAQYQKAFRELEATAKERVRVATQYGFDVVAIERKNAEDRAELAEQLADAQVGSLKRLIEEMTSGSLFEGSALERIASLNEAIAKAQADLDAGVEGAGDTLASLFEQRLQASRAAYGTTAGYAADRADTLSSAQAAIARVNAQITQAQGSGATSDPALATTNAALDENNDQNAQMLAALGLNNELLGQLVAAGGSGDFSQWTRNWASEAQV